MADQNSEKSLMSVKVNFGGTKQSLQEQLESISSTFYTHIFRTKTN
jgi:hypothetical protein